MINLNLTRVVRDLLLINLIFFLLTILGLTNSMALYPIGTEDFSIFQFITYMFIHAGFFHILMNMLALVFLGPSIERAIGYKRFLTFYLISGIGGALFHILITMIMGKTQMPMVGASGAVFGILTGFGYLFPKMKLQIWPIPIGIKAGWFSGIYFVTEIILGLTSTDNVAHFAHVGGGIFGVIMLYYFTKIKRN